jgi:hypothetical protein
VGAGAVFPAPAADFAVRFVLDAIAIRRGKTRGCFS